MRDRLGQKQIDCVDKLIAAALSYERDAIDVYLKSTPHIAETPEKVLSDFKQLRKMGADRNHHDVYGRHEDYFWSVFPYSTLVDRAELDKERRLHQEDEPVQDRRQKKPRVKPDLISTMGLAAQRALKEWHRDQKDDPIAGRRRRPSLQNLDSSTVRQYTQVAYQAVKDLISLSRFITDPASEWPESGIFEKEILYASKLAKDSVFRRQIDQLRLDYKAEWSTYSAGGVIKRPGVDALMARTATISDISQLNARERFLYDFDHLCEHYCLQGVCIDSRKRLSLIPEPFQIETTDLHLRISIPNYMEIDWRRELPRDVMRFMQQRGTWLTKLSPSHRNALRSEPKPIPPGFREDCIQSLKPDSKGNRPLKKVVLADLAIKHNLCNSRLPGSASSQATAERTGRRFARKAGIPRTA
jgi:hypothetical protein